MRPIKLLNLAHNVLWSKRAAARGVSQVASAHVVRELTELRGFVQKLGQTGLLSKQVTDTSPNILYERDTLLTQDRAFKILKTQWKRSPEDLLCAFVENGIAASIGQVHRATLKDGTDVAIKLKYPGIEDEVKKDLKYAKMFFRAGTWAGLKFDPSEYDELFRNTMLEELDYAAEATRQQQYAEIVKKLSLPAEIPRVFLELSNSQVITSEWKNGTRFQTACTDWTDVERKAAAECVFEHVFTMLLTTGKVHGDIHPGNIRFRNGREGVSLVLFDFGSVCELSNESRQALAELFASAENLPSNGMQIFSKLGFRMDLLAPMEFKLREILKAFVQPFVQTQDFRYSSWNLREQIAGILGEDRWNFRFAAPPQLLTLMRVFFQTFELAGRLSDTAVPRKLPIPVLNEQRVTCLASSSTDAKWLCIHVIEGDRTKVKLRLPAQALCDTSSWLDDKLRQRISEQRIDIEAIIRKARDANYPSGHLFRLDDGTKSIRVSLT